MLIEPTDITDISIQLPSKKRAGRISFSITLCIVMLIGGLFVAFPRQFMHQVQISLFRQPNPYTQLFFTQPDSLPSQLHPDRPNKFSFTIVNDEDGSETYSYTVTMKTRGSSKVARTGSAFIRSGDSTTCAITLIPKARRSQYLITVALNANDQSIHFFGKTS
jgi:hypothetical protein